MTPGPLAASLRDASYDELFARGGAARLLARPGAAGELAAVAADGAVGARERVLAHELLLDAGRDPDAAAAGAYCGALAGSGFPHNAWGMPGQYVERLGRTVLRLGEAAVPCLVPLLRDERPLGYFGSEEPTLSAAMRYRVCDLAADLLARIRGEAFPGDDPPAARDAFIARLQAGLGDPDAPHTALP